MKNFNIEFIKKANKFIIIKDDARHEFITWAEAATFYNNNVKTARNIELSAICGIVAKTIAYKYTD